MDNFNYEDFKCLLEKQIEQKEKGNALLKNIHRALWILIAVVILRITILFIVGA